MRGYKIYMLLSVVHYIMRSDMLLKYHILLVVVWCKIKAYWKITTYSMLGIMSQKQHVCRNKKEIKSEPRTAWSRWSESEWRLRSIDLKKIKRKRLYRIPTCFCKDFPFIKKAWIALSLHVCGSMKLKNYKQKVKSTYENEWRGRH